MEISYKRVLVLALLKQVRTGDPDLGLHTFAVVAFNALYTLAVLPQNNPPISEEDAWCFELCGFVYRDNISRNNCQLFLGLKYPDLESCPSGLCLEESKKLLCLFIKNRKVRKFF